MTYNNFKSFFIYFFRIQGFSTAVMKSSITTSLRPWRHLWTIFYLVVYNKKSTMNSNEECGKTTREILMNESERRKRRTTKPSWWIGLCAKFAYEDFGAWLSVLPFFREITILGWFVFFSELPECNEHSLDPNIVGRCWQVVVVQR